MKRITPKLIKQLLPSRPLDAHKGTFGKILVVGGSKNFPGAPTLASLGALRIGAGYVTIALPESVYPVVASKVTEPTFILLPEDENGILPIAVDILNTELKKFDAILIGNGLGVGSSTIEFVQRFLSQTIKQNIVVDADGLNILSLGSFLKDVKFNGVFTPHPGEMANLIGKTVEEVQASRTRIAGEYSRKWGVTLVLKGADTIIASNKGEIFLSPFSIPALATAGTGDILAGMIAGFLGQGLNSVDASILGAYIHAFTGEVLQNEVGDTGVIASDLLNLLPHVINHLKK
jgi:ADP-dependent NAD(P)H-hydrate dehydratase / NAD(P)H-hydrate epimerase